MPVGRAAEVLGVPVDAAPDAVQRAFVRAARRVHPDVLPATTGEEERRRAAAAFDDLVRARAVLLAEPLLPPPFGASLPPRPAPRPRGIGGSLVVLALLAFLLVAIVTAQDAMRAGTVLPDPPGTSGR